MNDTLTTHVKRCLGALLALVRRDKDFGGIPKVFFSRIEIGSVVYGHWQGVPLKSMLALLDHGFVQLEFSEALFIIGKDQCRCGCDRWTITQAGRLQVKTWNVKVPVLERKKRGKPVIISSLPKDEGFEPPKDWTPGQDDEP